MRDRIRKCFQLHVDGFELRGAPPYTVFQVDIELKNFFLCLLAFRDITLNRYEMRDTAQGVSDRDNFELHPVCITCFVVVGQFRNNGLAFLKSCANAVQFGTLGIWTLKNTR